MHVVADERIAGQRRHRLLHPQLLAIAQHGLDIEQPEAGRGSGATLDALGVGHAAPQHLEAAAEPEHARARPVVREDVDVPALLPQRSKVRPRRLASPAGR